MFYDLNVPYATGDEASLSRTLNFMHELGYNVVALNHTLSGKLPNELVCIVYNIINTSPLLTPPDLRHPLPSPTEGPPTKTRDPPSRDPHPHRLPPKRPPHPTSKPIRHPRPPPRRRTNSPTRLRKSRLRHHLPRSLPTPTLPLQIQNTVRGDQARQEVRDMLLPGSDG